MISCSTAPSTKTTKEDQKKIFEQSYGKIWNSTIDTLSEIGFVSNTLNKNEKLIMTEYRDTTNLKYSSNATYGVQGFSACYAERTKMTVRFNKTKNGIEVLLNPFIEHKAGLMEATASWKKVSSNGVLESVPT